MTETRRGVPGTIFFLFLIFFLNMLSRLGLAPFLPGIGDICDFCCVGITGNIPPSSRLVFVISTKL